MSKKALRGLIALVLVVVLAIGATIAWGIGSRWGEIKNVKDYFNGWGNGINNELDGNDKDENGGDGEENSKGTIILTPDEVTMSLMSFEVMPLSLTGEEVEDYATSTYSDIGYTITATTYDADGNVLPEEYQKFYFELDFINNTSGVIGSKSNISEYVTLSTTGRTAVLTLINSFNVPLKLICSYMFDSSIQATATVNCAPRIAYINSGLISGSTTGEDNTYNVNFAYDGTVSSGNWVPPKGGFYFFNSNDIHYTLGTIKNNILSESVTVSYTDELKSSMQKYITSLPSSAWEKSISITYIDSDYFHIPQHLSQNNIVVNPLMSSDIYSSITSVSDYFTKLKYALQDAHRDIEVVFNVELEYGGSYSVKFYLDIDFGQIVSNVGMDNNDVIL